MHVDRAVTSGTWASTDDPRYRTKAWYDLYITDGNLTEDDGVTQADYLTIFAYPDYPLIPVFSASGKDIDLVFAFGMPDSKPMTNYNHTIYGYEENVPVPITTCDKAGITGVNLEWKAQQELRTVAETYFAGSLRQIRSMKPLIQEHGGLRLYTSEYMLNYKRTNESVSDVTLSYGAGWEYDGDRLAGGVEGTWTEKEDGSTGAMSIYQNDFLTLTVSGLGGLNNYYAYNATALALDTDVYKKIRWRFITSSSSIHAEIIVAYTGWNFADTIANNLTAGLGEIVRTETGTSETASASLTAGKTIDYVLLFANDATGNVKYDFIQIYTADFTFPNVETLTFPPSTRTVQIGIPGRITDAMQNLGAESSPIEMTCNLDIAPIVANTNWQRPQSSATKTDYKNGDIFLDVNHNHALSQPWQWLTFGSNSDGNRIAIKAVLDKPEFMYEGEEHKVRLFFHEYSAGPKNVEYWYTRYGYTT